MGALLECLLGLCAVLAHELSALEHQPEKVEGVHIATRGSLVKVTVGPEVVLAIWGAWAWQIQVQTSVTVIMASSTTLAYHN